jgi:large subunit ribosomal protein L29
MNADKIRNLTDVELTHQQTELADQLFKLKFQMKMGQTESLKKIRDLKKDIARMKTIEREKRAADSNGKAVTVKKIAAPAAKAVETPKTPKAPKVAKAKKAASKVAATEKK